MWCPVLLKAARNHRLNVTSTKDEPISEGFYRNMAQIHIDKNNDVYVHLMRLADGVVPLIEL